jgi:hypothetical protein
MNRKTTWTTTRLLLQIVGGIALVAWFLLTTDRTWIKLLSAIVAGLSLVALYGILATIERRRALKNIAERVCNVSVIRPPRWDHRPVKEYVLRRPAVKALTAEHNQIARKAESELVGLGYGRREARKAIEIGRCEHGMYKYEALFQFALRKLSSDHQNIYQIGDVPTVERKITG